jgi:hypothetical protein
MSGHAREQWVPDRRRYEPLVLAVCATPLLPEAVGAALEGVATVRGFPAGRGDTRGLVARVSPDLVIVDTDEEADALETLAPVVPVLHVVLDRQHLRLRRNGSWEDVPNPDNSLEQIRNVLFGELLAAAGVRGAGRESD